MVARLPTTTPVQKSGNEEQRAVIASHPPPTSQWQPSPGGAGGSPALSFRHLAVEETWANDIDEMDVSKYPSLQHAFSALVAAYRTQRQTFAAYMARWKTERQELKSSEENLLQALSAVQDALKAETRAHDVDLATLEDCMHRNKMLEEQLVSARSQGFCLDRSSPWMQRAGRGDGVVDPNIQHDGIGIKAPPRQPGEKAMAVAGGGVAMQRYFPETDSYRVVKTEASVYNDEMRQNNAALMKQVDDLRKVNHELWEAYERQPGSQVAQHQQAHNHGAPPGAFHHVAPQMSYAASHTSPSAYAVSHASPSAPHSSMSSPPVPHPNTNVSPSASIAKPPIPHPRPLPTYPNIVQYTNTSQFAAVGQYANAGQTAQYTNAGQNVNGAAYRQNQSIVQLQAAWREADGESA